MTELLKQAIEKIERLSEDQQNAIATIILEELEDEIKIELLIRCDRSRYSSKS